MSGIFVNGYGAVSPAGWGTASLRQAVRRGEPLPTRELRGPTGAPPLRVREVPPSSSRPAFVSHPRLRRTSPIAHYAVAAALEALGSPGNPEAPASPRLGIIYCAMAGCVKYSQRFYDETLKDPATASPLVFPETVFNAPASHLAALLGTTAINYTLVGDPGTFLQGLALAADWLSTNRADSCLVVGAEELDWLVSEAFCLFDPAGIVSEGAGALYL
jgi:3-oxoacyl-(acyl-carrier-protein) synthase